MTGPGCDLDPRSSRPLRSAPTCSGCCSLIGTSSPTSPATRTSNRITAFERRGGGGFWEIETASEIDWPIQSRLIELMDNRDGTLSIFGTLIDHGATLATPAPGTPAGGFAPDALAALAREFAYNDPQVGVEDGAEGRPQDRNVELLLDDRGSRRRTRAAGRRPGRAPSASGAGAVSAWLVTPAQTGYRLVG